MVKRYAMGETNMIERGKGAFVSHEDYATLKAERDALAAENAGLKYSDLYIALRTESDTEILSDKHLTICYMSTPPTSKLDVNSIMPESAEATISVVEYWERVNLTVAIIDSPDAHRAHEVSKSAGFTYDLEFRPHVTLSCGDATSEYQHLVGKTLSIGSPYIRIKEAKKQTPATSRFIADVKAQGVEAFAENEREWAAHWEKHGVKDGSVSRCLMVAQDAEKFAQQLREAK